MTTVTVSWGGLMILLAVIGVPLLIVLGLVFAAIKHKNWTGLALLAFALSVTLGLFLFAGFVTVRGVRAQERVQVAHARLHDQALQIATETANTAPSPPPAPPSISVEAEIASDEELAAVASAPPKIELDEVAVETEATKDETADKTDEAKSDRPAWIDAHLGDNQKLITSGPFTTKESCESDTKEQIASWLNLKFRAIGGTLSWPTQTGFAPSPYVKSQYEEVRDTSVGEVHLLYTLAEITPEIESRIAKSLAEAAAKVAQTRGVRAVSFAGAGVLSLVALTHVVLKSGGRKAKNGAA